MTFARTANGISNYNLFYGTDIIIFIEGKKDSETETYDEQYYEAILKLAEPDKKAKIKPIGNKIDAINYHTKIKDQTNAFVLIDKDTEGVSTSIIELPKLIYTNGYSWENDFWSFKLVHDTLGTLGINNEEINKSLKKLTNTHKRLFKICCLDIGCQADGTSLFKKDSSSIGLNIDFTKKFTPSAHEFKRISKNYKEKNNATDCSTISHSSAIATTKPPNEVIQGHLWENVCKLLIGHTYKKQSGEKSAPLDIIKRIAISNFKNSTIGYIDTSYINYIKRKITQI